MTKQLAGYSCYSYYFIGQVFGWILHTDGATIDCRLYVELVYTREVIHARCIIDWIYLLVGSADGEWR